MTPASQTAAGIALAGRPPGRRRPVVAVIGDGALQYRVQALWTAAQRTFPLGRRLDAVRGHAIG